MFINGCHPNHHAILKREKSSNGLEFVQVGEGLGSDPIYVGGHLGQSDTLTLGMQVIVRLSKLSNTMLKLAHSLPVHMPRLHRLHELQPPKFCFISFLLLLQLRYYTGICCLLPFLFIKYCFLDFVLFIENIMDVCLL